MFEKASRMKLRFETPRGLVSTEDLWDLPLESMNGMNLDTIAIKLDEQLKNSKKTFVAKKPKKDSILKLKLDIVERVIECKLEESERKESEEIAKAKKSKILDIISEKEDESLKNMDIEDLKKLAKNL